MLYPTRHYLPPLPPPAENGQVEAAAAAILAAKKPVMIAGNGVRIAHAYDAVAPARRGGRTAGGDDRRRQGLFCRDPSAGSRRLRHLRHRCRQCLHRRSRSCCRGRLETVPTTPPGKTASCSTRPGRALSRSTSSRATRRGTSRPSMYCSATPRNSRSACRCGRRARQRPPRGFERSGSQPTAAPRLFQRPRLFRR